MNMGWKEKMSTELESAIGAMKDMAVESDEYKVSVDNVSKMADKLNEADRNEVAKESLKADKRDRLIKNVLTGLTFIGGAVVTIWGTLYSDSYDATHVRINEAGKFHVKDLLGFMKKR